MEIGFFTSIAHNMLSDMNRWTKSLSLAGVKDEEIDVNQLSTILRQTYVKELLGERRAKYEVFVSHTNMNYEEEATKFQTDGFFNSELGNTMPLALATALQFPIIIFPRDSNMSILHVTPDVITTNATAFVVHSSVAAGHYDAALPCHKYTPETSEKALKCSCGINDKSGRPSCVTSSIYATRCKCFLMSRKCSDLCRCVNCHNTYGSRPRETKVCSRKRRRHILFNKAYRLVRNLLKIEVRKLVKVRGQHWRVLFLMRYARMKMKMLQF